MSQSAHEGTPRPLRMWVTHCMLKKNGFPALGQFGTREAEVVIMPLVAWEQLCAEIPALAMRQFEVGAEE